MTGVNLTLIDGRVFTFSIDNSSYEAEMSHLLLCQYLKKKKWEILYTRAVLVILITFKWIISIIFTFILKFLMWANFHLYIDILCKLETMWIFLLKMYLHTHNFWHNTPNRAKASLRILSQATPSLANICQFLISRFLTSFNTPSIYL